MASLPKSAQENLFKKNKTHVILVDPKTGEQNPVDFSNSLRLNRLCLTYESRSAWNEQAGRNALTRKIVQNGSGLVFFGAAMCLGERVEKTQALVQQPQPLGSDFMDGSAILDPAHGPTLVALGMSAAFFALARKSSTLAREFFTTAQRNAENVARLKAAGARAPKPLYPTFKPVRFSMGIGGTP